METLKVKPVTGKSWPDLETLFESKGGPSYCWCMPYRAMDDRAKAGNADRKAALKSRVEKRVPIGLVGYLTGEPVAWCSLGPRESFMKLGNPQDGDDHGIWSVTCFFIRRDFRGRGLSAQMLAAAIAYARKRGAEMLEGYPVDPDSPSYRFMGFVSLFENRGFAPAGRAGTRKHIMQLAL
ncbi:GNAT family N-acetyltransferase [Pelagibacterium limicola]|uniref:GNAT family N-acetyltransferase n=1 Tax=Pelagibacterium limicola TaxID=2791022 RepID=UPI0018AFFF0A|nr:GNAT family N-acetyltransferase [Pelagibacterium limicola]